MALFRPGLCDSTHSRMAARAWKTRQAERRLRSILRHEGCRQPTKCASWIRPPAAGKREGPLDWGNSGRPNRRPDAPWPHRRMKHSRHWLWLLLAVPIAIGLIGLRLHLPLLPLLPPPLPAVHGPEPYHQNFSPPPPLPPPIPPPPTPPTPTP